MVRLKKGYHATDLPVCNVPPAMSAAYYSSDRAQGGDVIPETSEVSHWWKNTGDKTVVLLSVDLAKKPNEKDM
jgi:hypothetical protein